MAIGDAYMTTDEFKSRINTIRDEDDEMYSSMLLAASQQVEEWCGRQFNKTDTDEPRYLIGCAYRSLGSWIQITVDEIVSISEMALDFGAGTYDTIVDGSRYALAPLTAGRWPYTAIQIDSYLGVPIDVRNGIRITGVWGWPSVPAIIKETVFTIANRMLAMRTAPFGVSGSGVLGTLQSTTSLNPIIAAQLSPYRVLGI